MNPEGQNPDTATRKAAALAKARAAKAAKKAGAVNVPRGPQSAEDERDGAQDQSAAAIAKREAAEKAAKSGRLEAALREFLQGRHIEWLERVARREGRTVADMADRLIRLAYAADASKGGIYEAHQGGGMGEGGISGRHPASGNE